MPNASASTPINREASPKVPVPIAPNVVNIVGNLSFETLVCIAVCCGIFLIWPKTPTKKERTSAIAGRLCNPKKIVIWLNESNLPNQLKHGVRLIERWMIPNDEVTTGIFAIWEYDNYEK